MNGKKQEYVKLVIAWWMLRSICKEILETMQGNSQMFNFEESLQGGKDV